MFIYNFFCTTKKVDMKFNEKFYGIAYADFDRNSACQIIGKGDLSYRIELPLKGCGTKQVHNKNHKTVEAFKAIFFRNHKGFFQIISLCVFIQGLKWMEMKSSLSFADILLQLLHPQQDFQRLCNLHYYILILHILLYQFK